MTKNPSLLSRKIQIIEELIISKQCCPIFLIVSFFISSQKFHKKISQKILNEDNNIHILTYNI